MKSQNVNELTSHFHSVHGGWYEEGIRIQLIKHVAKVKVDPFASDRIPEESLKSRGAMTMSQSHFAFY